MITQLSFSDFIDDFHEFVVQKTHLLELLNQYINICKLIPVNWYFHYNKATGRPHDNSLDSIVSTLLLQKLLSIPTIDLLITFLSFSKEDIYKMAYNQMPKAASVDPNIKLQYINGTFCYAHKTVAVSNAFGVLRHMDFCDFKPDFNDDTDISVLLNFYLIVLQLPIKLFINNQGRLDPKNKPASRYPFTAPIFKPLIKYL